MSNLLYILIFLPILASIAIALGAPARLSAIGAALLNLVISLFLFVSFDSAQLGYQFAASIPVIPAPEISLSVGLDGMSLVMVLLTTIVTLCAVWVSPKKVEGSLRLYYISSLLIAAGGLGAFCATDLFFFYAFHELALIPTFLMIGIWGNGARKMIAWKITIYLGLGSVILLAGLLALFINLGGKSFDMATMQAAVATADIPASTQAWIFLTLLIGFGILISLFPFHSWAAPAYASAPAPTSMLHAGVLKKFGLYGLLRVAVPMLPNGIQTPLPLPLLGEITVLDLMLWLLLGNIIVIGLVTIAQKDLDLMLGNSSVMHMGYVFLGIAAYNTICFSGAVLLMFGHGISIALLFALAWRIREHTGTLTISRLGGFGKLAPFLGLTFGFAAFASIGLPGFANFAGEVAVFFGAFEGAGIETHLLQGATIVALWGVVISAVYMLRAYRTVFNGEPQDVASMPDLTFSQRIPISILVASLLIVGLYPPILLDKIKPGIELIAKAFAE